MSKSNNKIDKIKDTAKKIVEELPRITLPNGLYVVNLSSEHKYIFNTVNKAELPGISSKYRKLLELEETMTKKGNIKGWTDVCYKMDLSPIAKEVLDLLMEDPKVDIILTSKMVQQCILLKYPQYATKTRVAYISNNGITDANENIFVMPDIFIKEPK